MRIFNSLEEITNIENTVVALGNFDGVHKGHQELIRRTVNTARDTGLASAVFTFANHPRNVTGKSNVKGILYADEKAAIIESLGIDYLFNIPFVESIMTMSPERFIDELLLEKFRMKEGYCGFNYRFGYKAEGTPESLMRVGIEKGFGLHVLEPYKIDGNLVSSSFIRNLIEEGRVDECTKYMGRNYTVGGEVVVGNRLGKSIGFPTSNLVIDESMVTPPCGVYITYCTYNSVRYPSVTNVGHKPTIGNFEKNMETHIFNFDKELYGKNIRVEFLKKTRDEKKFEDIEHLKRQIKEDCISAQAFHRARS